MTDWLMVALLAMMAGIVGMAGWLAFRAVWAAYVNLLAATLSRREPPYHTWRWRQIRRYVLWRDRRRCQVCRRKFRVLDVHHIRPWQSGGSHWTSNLMAVDRACHARTHGRPAW